MKNSYWKDVAIRAVRTGVQVFAGVLMANQAGMFEAKPFFDFSQLDYLTVVKFGK